MVRKLSVSITQLPIRMSQDIIPFATPSLLSSWHHFLRNIYQIYSISVTNIASQFALKSYINSALSLRLTFGIWVTIPPVITYEQ